jgi:hypothetical protein
MTSSSQKLDPTAGTLSGGTIFDSGISIASDDTDIVVNSRLTVEKNPIFRVSQVVSVDRSPSTLPPPSTIRVTKPKVEPALSSKRGSSGGLKISLGVASDQV